MIRRIYMLSSVAGILATIAACGMSGTSNPTAPTVISPVNETVTAAFQATRTALIANVQATRGEYTQPPTVAGSRGPANVGTATGSAAIPVSTVVQITPLPGVTPIDAQTPPAASVFRDPMGRFSFHIPLGWSVQQSPVTNVVVTVVSVIPRGSANVATETLSNTQTLDAYTAATIAMIQREHAGYRFAAPGVQPTTLGAYPARRYEFSDDSGETGVRFVQYVTLVGTTAYVLTLTSTENDSAPFLQQAQVLVDTFTFETSATLTLNREIRITRY